MDTSEYKQSHKPAIDLLKEMGYKYISPEETVISRISLKNVLLSDILKEKLCEINSYEYNGKVHQFSEHNIDKAIKDLDKPLIGGLLKTNEEIYNKLILGGSYQEIVSGGKSQTFDIKYIDWDDISNNDFYVTEEFQVEGNVFTARPDIVLFINGIPVVVIEAKKPSVSINNAIKQMLTNQKEDYIPDLFKFTQIVAAINMNDFKYATCQTVKNFWSFWREEDDELLNNKMGNMKNSRTNTKQDRNIISLFSTNRLMDLIKDYIVFTDKNKIIARHQQYFAVKKLINTTRIIKDNRRKGGVIWHTQGSGKSLTMVMFAKYILENNYISDSKVVIVTDRVNLDKQITKTMKNSDLEAKRAKTSRGLIKLIQDGETLITTIVNKFKIPSAEKLKIDDKNIFILIDEAHRTQYGILNESMREVFPNACYIAFTGTPLMKEEKNTMKEFGYDPKPIHTYTIEDGVKDKAIVPLYYESRFVEQNINNDKINKRFRILTKGLSKKQTENLDKRWAKLQSITSSISRIEYIVLDIQEHYHEELKGTNFNAMLATNRVREALLYKDLFDKMSDLRSEVVVSNIDIKCLDADNIKVGFQENIIKEYGSNESYEAAIKEQFLESKIDILIVVDKLLTGFDAPKAKVLYIDKSLKEHSLLQAVARVNRIYPGKDKGKIIDYFGLLGKLNDAMDLYSGKLDGFDKGEISGALIDIEKLIIDLEYSYNNLIALFEDISDRDDLEEFQVTLKNEKIRDDFYDRLSIFSRLLGDMCSSIKIRKKIENEKLELYRKEFKFYQELRKMVKIRYSDDVDYKEYQPKMQKIIDEFIIAENLNVLHEPVDILDIKGFNKELKELTSKVAIADTIRTRISKSININKEKDPLWYKEIGDKLKLCYEKYKQELENNVKNIDEKYYYDMNEILKEYRKGPRVRENYPENLNKNREMQIFYDVAKEHLKEYFEYKYNKDEFVNISKLVSKTISNQENHFWYFDMDTINKIKNNLMIKLYNVIEDDDAISDIERFVNTVIEIQIERKTSD
jgi:type I restriction enzyme R subunit